MPFLLLISVIALLAYLLWHVYLKLHFDTHEATERDAIHLFKTYGKYGYSEFRFVERNKPGHKIYLMVADDYERHVWIHWLGHCGLVIPWGDTK